MYFVIQQNKTALDHIITWFAINWLVCERYYMTGLLVIQKTAHGDWVSVFYVPFS